MAVKKSEPWIVSDKVNFHRMAWLHDHGILHYTRRLPAIHLSEFEDMSVKMHRMRVVTLIIKNQTVASPLMNNERISMRKRFSIDQPPVVAPFAPWNFLEYQMKGSVWGRWR